MKKQKNLNLDKQYNLPKSVIISYNNLEIAVFPEIASWILFKNSVQKKVFKSITEDKLCVQELINAYKENQSDLVYVLTQIEAKQIEEIHPKSVFVNKKLHIHLTNKCNLRCPHCYMSSGFEEENELTTEEVFTLIKNFKNIAGGKFVDITGGEPTIRKDFFEIVEFADSIGMEVDVYTNGTNWREEDIKRFSKIKNRNVQISVDGFNEETNSMIRGIGSFSKSMKAIELFVKNDVHVKIAVTPSFELLKDYKSDYIAFLKGLIEKYSDDNISVNISRSLMQGRELSKRNIESFKDEYNNIAEDIFSEGS